MTRTLLPTGLRRTSCSILALATVMTFGATPAYAQFVGTIDSSSGIDTVNSTNSNLLITGNQAVINWTATGSPSGGQIEFLPDSNSVTFSSGSDFAVLNRVTPGTSGNAIYMGGNISSFAGDFTGGTVYFYSPNGIVIGANAVINVGSLGLTTSNISDDGNGNWMTGFGTSSPSVTFGGANPGSFVRVDNLAQLNANGAGNYVAIVAPVINHSGTIRTDGGAALVAAEAASITFSDSGLYNIQVDTGSAALQSLTVNGGKITRNSEAIGGDRHAYLVAVPKNDVTTLLITGGAELGFDVAGSAGVEGNTVVLNSGFNTVDDFGVSYLPDSTGNLTIDNASFTSNVETIAHGDTQISTYNGPTSFTGNLDITNDFNAFVGATASDLTIAGDLDIHTFYLWSVFDQPKVTLWAGSGATLSTGNVDIRANTQGGNSPDEFSPGQSITGGEINLTANDGGHIMVNGSLYGEVTGTGGAQDYSGGVGGDGTGGTINVSALGAGSSIDAGTTELYAYGYGGSTSECSSCDINGGIGHGGTISIVLDQGAAAMSFGALNTWATGQGGYGAGGNGGDGIGGTSTVSIGGGSTLSVNGNYFNFADGAGGSAEGAGTAGNGHGGTAGLLSTAGGGQIFFRGSDAYFTADAMGGIANGTGDGGDAFAGSATINVTDTAITVANPQQAQPFGRIYVKANAYGGTSEGGAGGLADATTGTVSMTIGANSTLSAGRLISTMSEAFAGQGINGGAAKGGTGTITVNSGGTLSGAVSQLAEATGGLGTGGPGGNATGGTARFTIAGGTATLSSITMDASGQGGQGASGTGGGFGTGGTSGVYGNAGTLTLNGDATLDANGTGGGTVTGGTGGNGTGGIAEIYAPAATVTLNGNMSGSAYGEGGDAAGGTGGNAQGGSAKVQSDGGTIHIAGNLSLEGGATGGDGATGGSATGRVSPPTAEFQPTAVMVTAANNGSVDVDGIAVLSAEAVGGNGSNGNGGNAQAGEADVIVFTGSIDINSLSIDVNAYGGNGGNGGIGGNAVGGPVDVAFGLNAAPILGTITLGSATITADGEGGAGGTGTSGTTGGNGGAGGNGSGGRISFTGSAAGGTLSSGFAILTSLGTGGAGGAGGTGSAGVGGNGGAGGIGTGGGIQTGTISNENSPNSGGGATYTSLSLNSSAIGGNGGAGGTGSSGNGAGGNGGNAVGGSGSFLARGVLVSADTVTMTMNATGGDGGLGATQGDGGNARSGSFAAEAKERFGHTDQRGRLQANSITGEAIATGGDGATDGVGSVIGGTYFRVLNGDADIGSISFNTAGDVYDNSFANSTVSVRDGVALVDDFSFTTTGELGLDASNGSMTSNSITLSAGTFIPDAYSISEGGPQAGPGTYSAGTFDITTSGDFITNADLVSAGTLDIVAPGLIDMRNATSSDGNLTLDAGSSILAGNLDAAGLVSVFGTGNVVLGNVNSGDFIDIESQTGSITTSDLSAVATIDLDAAGSTAFGDVVAEALDFDSGGAVTGGNILAAREVKGQSSGAIGLGDISVGISMTGGPADGGFAVGIVSETSIVVGNVEADESIGFATFGPLTTGDLSSGGNIMAMASGDMIFGSMTTTGQNGQIYLADSSMFTGAGGPDDFIPSLVLDAEPVATSGSITINGPVSTGVFRAAAGTGFTAQDISADGFYSSDFIFAQGIDVRAGSTATIDGIWTGQNVHVTSNDIDIAAGGGIEAFGVNLTSTNATRTIIGDGVDLSGYHLSDAEYNRLSGGVISVATDQSLGANPQMIIGDLTVQGSGEGTEYSFATSDSDNQNWVGSIRVVGDLVFNGMTDFDDVFFTTDRFELDAATGQLALNGNGTDLAGSLSIEANHIHVASGDILDQLASDPQYDGYQDDLNAPADTPRPEGVIRAGTIELEFGTTEGLKTLYVQNTGTSETPAGFLVTDQIFFGEDGEFTPPPGSIDLVINGQIVTEGGTLTGIDVRDAMVEDQGDLTPFTANSTINGCLLTGACSEVTGGPFPPDFTPTPGIQQEIVLLGDEETPPPPFGNEDVIDDNDEETEDTSPIVPPQPLFDTTELGEADSPVNPKFGTPMRSSPSIKQEGDVDDPVSGSGNPALMETPPAPSNQQESQQ